MAYNLKEQAQKAPKTESYMSAGIHENVKLAAATVETRDSGEKTLLFEFVNENEERAFVREWKPKMFGTSQWEPTLQDKQNMQAGRIVQILRCYLTPEEMDAMPNVSTFEELIDFTARTIQKKNTGQKLRLKLTYQKGSNFLQIPQNGYTFIEPMSITDTKIRVLKNDNMERVETDNEKQVKEVDSTSFTAPQKKDDDDDLPF